MPAFFPQYFGRVLIAFVLVAGSAVSNLAWAVDFPVTGSITVNDQPGEMPPGGSFANSGYDLATGSIAAGAFTFPITAETTNSDGVVFVLRYQFAQTDKSSGVVASDGVAALAVASFRLTVLSITANGFPYPIGQCTMQPIMVELAGTASASGLVLVDTQFEIPPVPQGQCGAFRDSFNDAFAGANNAMTLQVTGNFTPPSTADLIFKNGFDSL